MQAKYDDYDREDLKKQRLDFDKDMEKIEKDLKKQVDYELNRQQNEIRRTGAFKARTYKDNMVKRANVNDPERTNFSKVR